MQEIGNRKLSKWVIRLAYFLQLHKQSEYVYNAITTDESQVDMDLVMIDDEFAKKVKLEVYSLFDSFPEETLNAHNVLKNEADFNKLYNMPLSKYILLSDEQLSHFSW